jgi:sugar lactone lactonase YvrE
MTATATQLFVTNHGTAKTISVFALPLTSASTPSFTIATPTKALDAKFDASGNLWVTSNSSANCCVYEFSPPFSSSSTASTTLSQPSSGGYPWGLAFDSSGDLYVSGESTNDRYTPPLSPSSTPTTFGTDYGSYGISVDSNNRVFVANGTADGEIDVFNANPGASATPAFSLTVSAGYYIGFPAFDSAGNFYVPVPHDNKVYVYAPPISSTSVPAYSIPFTGAYSVFAGP